MVNRDNVLREYAIVRDENIKLKADNEKLLNALREIFKWGKTKDGKFTFVTSDIQANDFKELINNKTIKT